MAYLLGMICGNGSIRRGNTETTVIVQIPHRKLQTEENNDVQVYVQASIMNIRQIVEPLIGIDKMIKNRFNRELKSEKEIYNLTSGPGKISKAFGFTKEHSGLDLTNSAVFIVDQPKIKKNKIGVSKRIGITKSVSLPWRFFEIGNPYLSR